MRTDDITGAHAAFLRNVPADAGIDTIGILHHLDPTTGAAHHH